MYKVYSYIKLISGKAMSSSSAQQLADVLVGRAFVQS